MRPGQRARSNVRNETMARLGCVLPMQRKTYWIPRMRGNLTARSVGGKHSVSASNLRFLFSYLCRWQSDAVLVAVEHDASKLTGRVLVRLNPLACSHRCPHTLQKSKTSSSCITAVVAAHYRLDCFGCLIRMAERDTADIVVEDMGLNDTMPELAANKTKFTVN